MFMLPIEIEFDLSPNGSPHSERRPFAWGGVSALGGWITLRPPREARRATQSIRRFQILGSRAHVSPQGEISGKRPLFHHLVDDRFFEADFALNLLHTQDAGLRALGFF
jgi:hypothetical protein